ncbi:MAG: T9SS type A sorting domain-containing protein [Candidatus Eisenbacteria sp.]|nr:T9SS type A sorting domain-containing protein [Candidatus Eisenbacteria bacterium]
MMRKRLVLYLLVPVLLLCTAPAHAQELGGAHSWNGNPAMDRVEPFAYAVVIKESNYNRPNWKAVADALVAKYSAQLFIWSVALDEVLADVAAYQPTHIAFVCKIFVASPSFVSNSIWPFTRALDDDPYCDAIWGIVTGYDADDAMGLFSDPAGVEIKTVLGGTASCDLAYYTQGIGTSEGTHGLYYVKSPESLTTTTHTDGPTDRTEWLVTMINEGIDIFNYDPVDIFYTSGHGGHDVWQLHYPTTDLEGYFRSSDVQVYGDPHGGLPNININSSNPKIYFGLGNCNIGQILSSSSMPPSWIRTGAARQYTGYVIPEGSTSCQHGATKAYFYRVARGYTWAEAFFLGNQALQFDIINGTPGTNPPDLNGSALYGDPAMQMTMSNDGVFQQPLFESELTIVSGRAERDTVTFRITMNREGNPGFTSKWGERHPATILPFRAEEVEIIYTDAMTTVVEDDFALMYVWHQGQPSLAEGETREVVFTCKFATTGVEEETAPRPSTADVVLHQNHPNPFNPVTSISYSLAQAGRVSLQIYNLRGQLVETLVDEDERAGSHSVAWDAGAASSGLYFYRVTVNGSSVTRKCLLLK